MAIKRVTTTHVSNEKDVVKEAAPYSAVNQLIYLIFGVIEGLLVLRFFFRLAGANPLAGFVQLVYAITNALMRPFFAIFPTARVEGAVFEWSVLVALVVYALLAWILMYLVSIFYTADQAD